MLRFVMRGLCHEQMFDRFYTPRGLVTLARRFAHEVERSIRERSIREGERTGARGGNSL